MSNSYLYAVYKTTTTRLAIYPNGWGTCPILWDFLSEKYLNKKHAFMSNNDDLWALHKDKNVPQYLRVCLALTFDYAYCGKDKIKFLSECCAKAHADTQNAFPERVNHWGVIGLDLQEFKLDKRSRGIALEGTSVNDMWLDYKSVSEKQWDFMTELRKELK